VLLHLCSLGVELQFYLLVSLIAWVAARTRFALPIVFCASLAACLYVIGISPKTSFFMMPLRLWEFIVGFAIAIHLSNDGAIRTVGLSFLGAIAVVVLVELWRNIKAQDPLRRRTLGEYQAANQALSDELSNIRNKSFQVYEIGSIFCHDACELITDAGKPLYFDGGHLEPFAMEKSRTAKMNPALMSLRTPILLKCSVHPLRSTCMPSWNEMMSFR
jgi:hypothetical protein